MILSFAASLVLNFCNYSARSAKALSEGRGLGEGNKTKHFSLF